MKPKYFQVSIRASRGRFIPSIHASALAFALALTPTHAATLYWDLNGTTANTAVAVTGAWNGTNAFWNTASTGTDGAAQAANTNADDLVFTSGSTYTAGTVTASGARVARSLTFEDNIEITLAGAITVGGTGGTPGIFTSAGKITATTVSGALTLASACNYQNNDAGLLTLSGTQGLAANALTKSGTGPVTVSGVVSGTTAVGSTAVSITNGTLTLSGANTFRGNIAVAGSSSVLAMPGATYTATAPYGASGTANVYKQLLLTNGGTFRLTSGTFNNNGTGTNQAGGIIFNIGTGGGTLDIASGTTLIIDDGSGTGTGGGASQIQGTGNLTKKGLGIFQFDDSTGYAGTITVTEGLLQPASANAFGASSAGTTIQSGAALNVNGITMTNAEPLTINGTGLASAPLGALTNSHATNAAAWTGTVNVASASDIGGNGTGLFTVSGVISGSGALSKVGTGLVRLTGNSSAYAAGITVRSGILEIGTSVNAAGTGTILLGDTTGTAAATLSGISSLTHANPITVQAGSSGVKTLRGIAAAAPKFTGLITLDTGLTVANASSADLVTGITDGGTSINLNGNTLTITNTAGGRYFADGVIYGSGSVDMNTASTTEYVPRGDHTYSGGTTLTAGSIAVDRNSIGPAGAPTSGAFGTGTLTIAAGRMRSGTGGDRTVGNAVTLAGDLAFHSVASEKVLIFTGPVTLSGGNRTITADVGTTVVGKSTIFTGIIGEDSPGRSLTKAGTGNLTLAGANTYTGGTTVNSGTLILTGSLASSTALTVSPTVAGGASLNLVSGAANPWSTVSALTLGSATGPTTLGFDLGANTAASDSLTTAATATTTGIVNIAVQALAGFGSSPTYDLINAPGGLDGATYALTNAPGGFNYSLTTTGTLVQLDVTPATAGDRYWRGNLSNSWSALSGSNTNWFNDAAGGSNAQTSPSAGDTVNFSTVNAVNSGGVITTTLDNNFTVNDLVFGSDPNGVSSVTIAGGLTPAGLPGVLAIAPASSADGITVGSNAGVIAISAPVLLGAAQTWSVDGTGANGSALTVSGALSGTAPVTISGLVTLSAAGGTSTHSGTTTVPNGAILQGGATNSFSASTAVTVDATGVVRLNGINNRVASLTGTGTVQNNHAATGATLTVGDATDFTFAGTLQNGAGGALGLTKAGTGVLTLSGTNTNTGATTINEGTIQQGVANALTAGTALTVNGTSVFDLNGADASFSTLGGVATGVVTDNAAGSGTSTLSITAAGSSAVIINDGATRDVALRVANGNGGFLLTNGSNTFSGGIVLTHSSAGTRMSPGTITAGAYGSGPITIGESPADNAGIYFATGSQTLANPIIFNTALGTDRVGIRADAAGIILSGVITANLAPATFTANTATAGSFTLTNQVTGASGLVLDITSLSASATAFLVTLNNATISPNNYQGDTVINFNAASGKSATLEVAAADQIPNGVNAGNVIVNRNGTGVGLLRLAGVSETINGLSGSGNVASTSGTVILTLGDNNATASHSGSIDNTAGTLSVTKIGTGTQTLSGVSNFAGALTVNGGLVAFPSSPASAGPLGNSTVVNLNGGGISFTAAGANNLSRPIAIVGSAGTVDVANATGVLTLAATSTGGDLVKTGPGVALVPGNTELNLAANGAGVVVSDGTLQAGFGTADVATVTVGATGNLNLTDSAAEALTLENSAGALTLNGGAQLGLELDGAGNDSIAVAAGGTAVTSGTVTLNFYGNPAAGTYNLLTAPGGGLLGATYALGVAPNGFNYTITATDTLVSVTVTPYIPNFWRGGQDLSWNTLGAATANWTADAAGTVDAGSKPGVLDTVIFSATGAPTVSNAINTTLDAAFTVDSLQFTNVPAGITDVLIAPGTGGLLTLTPLSTSGGIRVLSNGGNAVISAPLTIGAAQTWDVDPTGSLTVSGDTVFNGNVTKSNTGVMTLSGTNSGAGAITLAGGTLNLNSAAGLGSGLFTIGAGTTLNTPAGAIALATNNTQVWNGDYTFTGANSLDLGNGPVTLGNSLTVNTPGSTLTVGGIIGDGGNNRGLAKAGAGMLVLDGANSYGGPTAINAGVLRITSGAGLGTTTAGTTQSGASALELDGTDGAFSVGTEPLTINGGGITNLGALRNIAGDNTYGGTVTMGIQSRINSDSGTLTLSSPTAVSAAGLTLVVGGAGNTTISGAITTGTGGVNKADGAGVLTLSGANTYVGNTTVGNGTLNMTGSLAGNGTPTAGSNLLYGTAAGNSVVNVSGNISDYFRFQGATVAGSNAAYIQTAGTVNFTSTQITNPNHAVASAGYGYMEITGGSLKAGGRFAPSNGTATTGVMFIGGSGTLDNTGGEWFLMSYSASGNGGQSMLTVDTGGTLDRVGSSNNFGLNMDRSNGYAVLNIVGGAVLNSNRAVTFGNGTSANITGSSGFLNLAAGTLQIGTNMLNGNTGTGSTGNSAYLNFAGGTLKAQAALTNAIPVTAANQTFTSTVYGPIDNPGINHDFVGGLTVDTNSFATTLANNLVAPSSDGVTESSLTITPGSGYIGAPMVQFTGGTLAPGGAPAAGYAVVSGGAVTQIVITAPGSYTAAPSVTLTGGGGTGASVVVGALIPNTSGGLTKIGSGVLTLTGANTYTGTTLVSGGTLQLNGSAATTPTTSAVTVATGGTFGFTAAAASTLDLSTKDMTLGGGTLAFDIGDPGINDAITVDEFALTANSAFSFTSIGAIGGSYTLVNANSITNVGSHTISGQTIGRVTLTPSINANTITVASSLFEGKWALTGGGNWSLGDPNATLDNWLNYKPTVPGDAALFGDTITAPSTVVVDTPHTVGYIRFDNANAYTIGSNSSSFLTLNNGTGNAVATVTTGSHTIAENVALLSHLDVIPAAGTALTMSGGIGGAKNLEVNGAGDVTISGAIATSTGAVVKDGTGTLVLSGANTYTGATAVRGGRLFVNGGTVGSGTIAMTVSSAAGKPMLDIAGTGTVSGRFQAGNAAGQSGAIYQTGGTANAAGNGSADNFMGVGSGGYAFYQLSGGSLNSTSYMSYGNHAGTGLFYQTGGAVNLSGSGWFQLGYGSTTGSNGVAYLAGGTFTAPSGQLQALGYLSAAGIRGEITIAGTDVTSPGTVNFGHSNSTGGTGIINLRSGTLQATNIVESIAAVTSVLNLNGGTFKAAASAGTLTGLNFAYVHSGGAVIDTSLSNFTIGQALLAPAGDGVATIPVTDAGAGYIGAPYVQITGGSSDATAVALMVDDGTGKGTYKVDSILVTNPGTNYDATAPTVALVGGSPATVATLGSVTTAANVSGGLTKTDANTLSLTGASTYTGATLVSGGTLQIGAAGTTGGISPSSAITNNSVFAVNRTNATVQGVDFGEIGGSGSFTQAGSSTSTTTLNVANTYGGGTAITGGILSVTHANALGSGTVAINGGVRFLVATGLDVANPITIGTNTGVANNGLVQAGTTAGTATVSGPITINNVAAGGGHFAAPTAGTVLHVQGAITSSVQVSQRNGTVMFSGGGTGYSNMIVTGTTIVGAVDGIATSANVIIGGSAAATLDLNGLNQSLAGITKGGSAGTIGNSSTTSDSVLTITGTSSFAGVIQDVVGSGTRKVSLTVASGSLALAGVNTYTGNTSVTGGTLIVTGSIASTASVATTGTLAGNGTIAGATTVATTGVVSPGSGSEATLNFSDDLTLDAGSEYAVGITGATANDKVNVTDTLTANGTIKVTITGYTPVANDTFDIADAASITGTPTFDFSAATLGADLKWDTSTFATNGQLKVVVDYYGIWANGTFANPLTQKLPGDDQDGDGFNNLMEYAFGTDPTVSSTGSITYSGGIVTGHGQPVLEIDGGVYYAVFGRRTDFVAAGLTYTVEFSNALSSWTATAAVPTVIATDGVIDAVRVPFLNFVPSDSGPQKPTFFRVVVSD